MKKLFGILVAFVCVLFMASCGKKDYMSYKEFAAAEKDADVVIESYVQAHQDWWDNKVTLYLQDGDGAIFVYEAPCSEEDSKKLEQGVRVRVAGKKSEWAGEVEIMSVTEFKILDNKGRFVATPTDLTSEFGKDTLINHMNELFSVKAKIVEYKYTPADSEEQTATFTYKWDNSGKQGDDLYFNVEIGGKTFTFTVESYLRGKNTDVYKAVEALQIGDQVTLTGFLYWYNGANPHIISLTK